MVSARWKGKQSAKWTIHIRKSHQENREINLNQEYEVRYAESVGAIKIAKNGAISPVSGRTYVKNNRLYYTPAAHAAVMNKRHEEKVEVRKTEHKEHRGKHSKHSGRSMTSEDRKKWASNSMKGTEKWHLMPHAERVERRKHPKGNWGFEGVSPNTRNRR